MIDEQASKGDRFHVVNKLAMRGVHDGIQLHRDEHRNGWQGGLRTGCA